MPKNIIICSDGTGNTAVKDRGTNVFKMFEAIDLNSHRYDPQRRPQVAIYDDGVGTERFKPLKILGGIGGLGLSRNVRQLYKELCRIYDPGDGIFLFGFSRGAFTIRTLGGLITTCGIVRIDAQDSSDALHARVLQAYRTYRRRYRTALAKLLLGEPDSAEQTRFKQAHCHGQEKITFIGVWDTVDAVGLPLAIADLINHSIYQFKFPNLTLSPSVERAHHALAIDDERQSFHPLLWDQSVPGANPDQLIEQVWFAGAHSNVGGGYPKQGMSLVALDWIMERAERAGLRFVEAERRYYQEHTNVDDKLYDPRAGAGIFYRWMPRDIAAICARRGVAPALHLSVLERAAHGTEDYGPGNLPPHSQVVITSTGNPAKDCVAHERASEVQSVLKRACPGGHSLLDEVRSEVRIGHLSHRVFLLSCIALPIGAAARTPFLLSLAVAGFMAAYVLATYAKRGMRRTFSAFWFAQQQQLRDALKRARAAAGGPSPAPPARDPAA